jgi:signal peptidase II
MKTKYSFRKKEDMSLKSFLLCWIIIVILIGLDFYTKYSIQNYFGFYELTEVVKNFVSIYVMYHLGSDMLVFGEHSYHLALCLFLFLALSSVLVFKAPKLLKIGITLIVAGAMSNFLETILYGKVIDFIFLTNDTFGLPIIFNVADIYVFFGILIAGISSLFSSFFIIKERLFKKTKQGQSS